MSLGVPRSMAAAISSAVTLSTQPPETDPAMVPSAVASIDAPGGRGAEPQTLVTTARPNGRPVAVRRSRSAKRSRTVLLASTLADALGEISPEVLRQPARGTFEKSAADAGHRPAHYARCGPVEAHGSGCSVGDAE